MAECPVIKIVKQWNGITKEPVCDFMEELVNNRAFFDLVKGETVFCKSHVTHETCLDRYSALEGEKRNYINDMVRAERYGKCLSLSKYGVESKSRRAQAILRAVEQMQNKGLISEKDCIRTILYTPFDPEQDELVEEKLPKIKAILRERGK